MRTLLLLALLSSTLLGCRTTREADEEEIAQVDSLSGGLRTTNSVGADQGQAAVGSIFSVYGTIQALSEEEQDQPMGSMPMAMRDGAFTSRARAGFPECVTSSDHSFAYNQCEYAFSGDVGVSFLLDGEIGCTDTSADGDLSYDLSVSAEDIGVEIGFDWGFGFQWSDTTLQGDFEMNWASGVSIGALPGLNGVTFEASGTIDPPLTWDASCTSGPVSGTFDWRSTYREGNEPPETEHVTIEYVACGQANITI